MSDKRYYWIKLKSNFFDLEAIDWLQSQTNGCEYIVLYQKLCLLAANKNGQLFSSIGEMLVPYDANKIARDTKFNVDTVVVALELFKKLGLIYQQENGVISIPYVDEIVGSETEYAEKKREYRKKTLSKTLSDKSIEYKSIEYRDIDNRDIDIKEREINKEKEKTKRDRFVPPTLDDVRAYYKETGKPIDAEAFIDYYSANGWKTGKNPMKDWKAAVRQWRRRDEENGKVYKEPRHDLDEIFPS